MDLKDSGSVREFETGGRRDSGEGKGRMDLIPWDMVLSVEYLKTDEFVRSAAYFLKSHDLKAVDAMLEHFIHMAYAPTKGQCTAACYYTAMLEVSKIYEQGAVKYGENNWKKGMPTHVYLDCALRHYFKWQVGWQDESHDRAVVWNLLGLKWTIENKPELDDIPKQEDKEEDKTDDGGNDIAG